MLIYIPTIVFFVVNMKWHNVVARYIRNAKSHFYHGNKVEKSNASPGPYIYISQAASVQKAVVHDGYAINRPSQDSRFT